MERSKDKSCFDGDINDFASEIKRFLLKNGIGDFLTETKRENWIEEYFAGRKITIDIDQIDFSKLKGTDFQISVWREIAKIPYGKITTYSEIAKKIGRPLAVRAVGTAVGANPWPVIIPCHRVLPLKSWEKICEGVGDIEKGDYRSVVEVGGFAWGKTAKTMLLELEGVI